MLLTHNQEPFAVGSIQFNYQPVPPDHENLRLILRIEVEGIPATAVVDTGAPYMVIAPHLADQLDFDPANALERAALRIRGDRYQGFLHRVNVSFDPEEGESLSFTATAFVPARDVWEDWLQKSLPSFLGLSKCLDRIRFAVDPSDNRFYFGDLA